METENLTEEDILQKQRKEKKELQGKIQALKKSINKADKKRKRELSEEIARLESELDKKHEEELSQFSQSNANVTKVTDAMNNLSVENENDETAGVTHHRITKAQRRRDKKATQLQQRELSIAEQERLDMYGVWNVEIQDIKRILKERNLMIHEIPPDGNCLYNAIEHQLRETRGENAPGLNDLRRMTSDFLRENSVDFLPYLSHPDTGEMFTEQQFQAYCDQVANTPAWGGQIELRALSHILKCCIEVIQGNSPPVIVGEEYKDSSHITLTFHRYMYGLGEHYNSVEPYKENEEENIVNSAEIS